MQLDLARNMARKLRTTRHPYILKFLESAEHQGSVYIVVERVKPLTCVLQERKAAGKLDPSYYEWIVWGLSQVAEATAFLNEQAKSMHGNIHLSTVFQSQAGEWLLGGLETLSSMSEPEPFIMRYGGMPPEANRYAPPEVVNRGWNTVRDLPVHSVDAYGLALLAIEACNGTPPANPSNFTPGRVPASMVQVLKQMLSPSAQARPSTSILLTAGSRPGSFLESNELVRACKALEDFRLAPYAQKRGILEYISGRQARLPAEFLQVKVVPVLAEAFRYRQAAPEDAIGLELSSQVILPLMLKLGSNLSQAQWTQCLGFRVVESFNTTYPPLKLVLLENAELYVERIPQDVIARKVWPLIAPWFEDPYMPVRAAMVQKALIFAPKLTDRILNNELLRQLAKTQVSPDPRVRTETTVLLGRLTSYLTRSTQSNVLIPAFSRSLKDNYEQARLAGVQAFRENADHFDMEVIARQVIPILSPCLIDKHADIRDAAGESLDLFLGKVKAYASSLPSAARTEVDFDAAAPPQEGRLNFGHFLSTAGNAASALSDWAVSQVDAPEAGAADATPRDSLRGSEGPESLVPVDTSYTPHVSYAAPAAQKEEVTPATQSMPVRPITPPKPVPEKKGMSLGQKASMGKQLSSAILNEAPARPARPIRPSVNLTANRPSFAGAPGQTTRPVVRPPGAPVGGARPPSTVQPMRPVRPVRPVQPRPVVRPAAPAAPVARPAHTSAPVRPTTTAPAPPTAASSADDPWGDFDDLQDTKNEPAAAPAAPATGPKSKEEKKLELERLREERRAVSLTLA